VIYRQSSSNTDKNTMVAVSVMSGLAVLYAFLLTCSWYRRSGRFTVDLLVLFKFLLFALGTVADAIFVVVLGSALYHLCLYKVGRSCIEPAVKFHTFLVVKFYKVYIDDG